MTSNVTMDVRDLKNDVSLIMTTYRLRNGLSPIFALLKEYLNMNLLRLINDVVMFTWEGRLFSLLRILIGTTTCRGRTTGNYCSLMVSGLLRAKAAWLFC